MKGYFKRDKQNVGLTESNDLPKNALEWAAVFKADKPEFSYKFVNT